MQDCRFLESARLKRNSQEECLYVATLRTVSQLEPDPENNKTPPALMVVAPSLQGAFLWSGIGVAEPAGRREL